VRKARLKFRCRRCSAVYIEGMQVDGSYVYREPDKTRWHRCRDGCYGLAELVAHSIEVEA